MVYIKKFFYYKKINKVKTSKVKLESTHLILESCDDNKMKSLLGTAKLLYVLLKYNEETKICN